LAGKNFGANNLKKFMNVTDKIIFVTGGANGIGKALCERFAKDGAKKIVVADVDYKNAMAVADEITGKAIQLDVSDEAQVKTAVEETLNEFGQIDLVCSNAGIGGAEGCLDVSNEVWRTIYEINVLSHLYLSRAVFPSMIKRGAGYFLITASAAGLLTHPTAAPYVVSKHAAVAFAEWLSIAYLEQGIKVSCLCPQGVKTDLIASAEGEPENFLMAEAITAEACADAVVRGLGSEKFLILPHAEVAQYIVNKAENYDRWLHSLRKIRKTVLAAASE
jgi:NAD(P)-dependent dehydrogenase (short-subunit alcohol dehydrogenase family)